VASSVLSSNDGVGHYRRACRQAAATLLKPDERGEVLAERIVAQG
jgi:hypothetical protein